MTNSDQTTIGVPPWEALAELFAIKTPPSSTPLDGVVSTDITIDSSRSLWFRLYVPSAPSFAATSSLPLIVYYHGGGFVFWSPEQKPYDDLCRRLSRELSAVVVSVNYRLAPEHRCPVQYEDGFEVLKFLDRPEDIEGFPEIADVGKCFLAGDSAGGNLAHHVAVEAAGYEFQAVKILGLVAIQPSFGGEERTGSEIRLEDDPILPRVCTDWSWSLFLPEGSDRDHPSANVFGPRGRDISGLKFPKTLVVAGGLDPLLDRDKAYFEWLIRSGIEAELSVYPNMPHVFYVCQDVLESSLLITEIKGLIQTVLG
ncbi:hypothetical protein Dimus_012398 [Dionaea muscipula]